MKATLLGTGCPVVHPKRRGAATLITAESTSILIDCGSGVTQRLVESDTEGAAVDALLLTHLHSDHLVDLYQLIISSWHQGRDRPWIIYGPRPVLDHVSGLMDLWAPERQQRIAFEDRENLDGFELDLREISAGQTLNVGPIDVTVVEVDHAPVVPAFGFVFRSAGHTIVHSGDTRRCEALLAAGKDADLLIHEVYLHTDSEHVRKTASYHTMSSEVGAVARDMGAAALALTHFVPVVFDRQALLAEVGETFSGPTFVGEDLMQFDLATDQVSWRDMACTVLNRT